MVEQCDGANIGQGSQHRTPDIAGKQGAADEHEDGQDAEGNQGQQSAPQQELQCQSVPRVTQAAVHLGHNREIAAGRA